MRKAIKTAIFTAALALPMAPAVAADLSNAAGQSCPDGIAEWHFVNNQTGGAAAGTLTATFTNGTTVMVEASKVNQSNQQFFVRTEGGETLLTASTNLPGRLVISDFECDGGKKK